MSDPKEMFEALGGRDIPGNDDDIIPVNQEAEGRRWVIRVCEHDCQLVYLHESGQHVHANTSPVEVCDAPFETQQAVEVERVSVVEELREALSRAAFELQEALRLDGEAETVADEDRAWAAVERARDALASSSSVAGPNKGHRSPERIEAGLRELEQEGSGGTDGS